MIDGAGPNRFQQLVAAAKKNVTEMAPDAAAQEVARGAALFLDVRSGDAWKTGHAQGARHLERGEVEVEIEELAPDLAQPIICYCGGGSRSALVAESLQKMGYRNVRSMSGGFREWHAAGLPTEENPRA